MLAGSFTADIAAIRERTRRKMEEGPVTGSYGKDPKEVIAGRAHTTYETYRDEDLAGMLRDNLAAERVVITTYQEIIRWLGADDPTTRRLLEGILAYEEEHADALVDLLGA
jgi:bacterioferritin